MAPCYACVTAREYVGASAAPARGLSALLSPRLQHRLTSKRAQGRPPLLGKKTRQAWDQEIARLGKTPAQISADSWGNLLPEPRAKHGCDTSGSMFSHPAIPAIVLLQPPAHSSRGREVSREPHGLSLPLPDSAPSCVLKNSHPWTQCSLGSTDRRCHFWSRCSFEVCSVSRVTATHPGQDVVCLGVSKEVVANRPICPHESPALHLVCEVAKLTVPRAERDGLSRVLPTGGKGELTCVCSAVSPFAKHAAVWGRNGVVFHVGRSRPAPEEA